MFIRFFVVHFLKTFFRGGRGGGNWEGAKYVTVFQIFQLIMCCDEIPGRYNEVLTIVSM